ncbi:hypothetical protein U1Q18_034215 [Sarracenia purpurea var. burkii]
MVASARSERRSGNASVLEEFLAIEDFGSEKVFFESPWVSRALRRRRVKRYQVFWVKQSTTGETPTIFLVAISGTTPASESFFGDWFSSEEEFSGEFPKWWSNVGFFVSLRMRRLARGTASNGELRSEARTATTVAAATGG